MIAEVLLLPLSPVAARSCTGDHRRSRAHETTAWHNHEATATRYSSALAQRHKTAVPTKAPQAPWSRPRPALHAPAIWCPRTRRSFALLATRTTPPPTHTRTSPATHLHRRVPEPRTTRLWFATSRPHLIHPPDAQPMHARSRSGFTAHAPCTSAAGRPAALAVSLTSLEHQRCTARRRLGLRRAPGGCPAPPW